LQFREIRVIRGCSFDGLSCIPKPPHLPGVMALLTAWEEYEDEMAFLKRGLQYYADLENEL